MSFARSAVLRRWYFITLTLTLFGLAVVRLKLIPKEGSTSSVASSLGNVTDNLIAAVVTSLIVGLAYVYLYPTEERSQQELVRSRDIAQVIEDEARHAREWSVKSRAANYFTTVTLDAMVEMALKTGRGVRVKVQVIDPEDSNLLEGYAKSMQDLKSRVGIWSPERARREVYASLLRAAIKTLGAPKIDIEFGLSPSLWVVSLDISNNVALATCQNKGTDALLFRCDTDFYDSFYDDFEVAWNICRLVRPQLPTSVPLAFTEYENHHFDTVRAFFLALGLPACDRDELEQIVKLLSREHDYA